jgi:hypothetical protein
MDNLIRLTPPIFLITPLGDAEAYFLQAPLSNDTYVYWGVFIKETKENWWFDNTVVRICESVTARRSGEHSEIYISDGLFETLRPHIIRHKKSPFYLRALETQSLNDRVLVR